MEMDQSSMMEEDIQAASGIYDEDDEHFAEHMIMQECPIEIFDHTFSVALGLGYPQLPAKLSDFKKGDAVAYCSFVYRYHDNGGKGAMKYQPVGCSNIYLPAQCEELRQRRGRAKVKFKFEMLLKPGCNDVHRKVMAVPTIGCPALLKDINFCRALLWAAHAEERPTFLVVHGAEAKCYMDNVGDVMEKLNVGIVSWTCDQPIAGFGVSRLAAQQAGLHYSHRGIVVMSDVNVVNTGNLQSGYETDREDKLPFKSTYRYSSMGSGSGVPVYKWRDPVVADEVEDGAQVGMMVEAKKSEGGGGRPLEQVIMISDELMYDPCFITSSEDSDVTATFVAEERSWRSRGRIDHKTFRVKSRTIEKVDMGNVFLTQAYGKLRDDYLATLTWEDDVKIEYYEDEKIRTTTVGTLAKEFADKHKISALHIRSLIIEKILLKYKEQALS
ncbi:MULTISPECIES: hypothetical protein [unclassified Pseudomonas]|uniref:hypothetical protein n=1 Tax=unclassified Pseudomonas TaxID=196821 RepID=UPI000A1F770A|nr:MULTISPECIES: hypothetical protein [unclassified Pseudomonas]